MTPEIDTYEIVIATDANYLTHSFTLLKSIEIHLCSHPIRIHVFSFSLSKDEKASFESTFKQMKFVFYDLNNETILGQLGCKSLKSDRSLATYARLLIPKLLPANINRCIYMDVDAIVLRDIQELLKMDLTDFAIAGVSDANPLQRRKNVGINKFPYNYINAGLILWNMEWCRKEKVVNQFAQFIDSHKGEVDASDQGTLNGCLSKYIKIIPPQFNMITAYFQMNQKQINDYYGIPTYTNDEICLGREKAAFVHFTPNLTTRPWQKNCRHPLKHLYWKYRLLIEDEHFILSSNPQPIKIRILSELFHCLPNSLFVYFVKSLSKR